MAIIRARLQVNHRFISMILLLFILAMDTGFSSFDSEMSVSRSNGATTSSIGRQGFPKDIISFSSSSSSSSSSEMDDEMNENDEYDVTSTSSGMKPYKRYLEKGRLWLRSRRQWPLVMPINTVKRGSNCMRKCLAQGYLHPAQCHSLC
ncbi:hypothetical protein CHUAL_005472 [Chamberlinius hualienensis]